MEQIAGLREQWLTQIAEAIESAQKLAWQLRTAETASPEARELYGRLETIRIELQSPREAGAMFRTMSGADWFVNLGLGGPAAEERTDYKPSAKSPPPEKG